MSKEIWKDIFGYEGLYQVSDQGRVKSLERKVRHWRGERTVKERILKPSVDKDGYLKVSLCDRKNKKNFFVHRLICEVFHENPDNKPQVNHLNEDKSDNRAYNLEWSTPRENNNFGTRNERIAKTQSKPVGQYTLDGELIKVWASAREVKSQTGFYQTNIGAVANGKLKQAYGFVWKYISKEEV